MQSIEERVAGGYPATPLGLLALWALPIPGLIKLILRLVFYAEHRRLGKTGVNKAYT
jgi:hypothetical protein